MTKDKKSSLTGILLMTTAVLLFACKDALVKSTGGYYSPILIMWLQLSFMAIMWLPFLIAYHGWRSLLPKPFLWQFVRGASIAVGMALAYWSIILIPMTDAIAMAFVAPLVVATLSPFLLKESIGVYRILAVIFGFVGALILLRPLFVGEGLGYLIGLLSGIAFGIYYTANRRTATAQSSSIMVVVYPAYIGTVLITPFVPFTWTPPRIDDSAVIIGFMLLTYIGQTLLLTAFRFGEATVVAPFHYMHLVGATILGYIFFSEIPDFYTWFGVVIIVASGLFIAFRENRAN